MRRKNQTEIEIPRIGIKVQSFLGLFYLLLFLVSSFCMFVLYFLILVSIFEMLVLNVTSRLDEVHSVCNYRGTYVHQVPL